MTKRRICVLGFVGMATFACAAIGVVYWCQGSINAGTSAKIREGMSESDVNQLCGQPCDSTALYQVVRKVQDSDGHWREFVENHTMRIWRGSAGSIHVDFAESGVVNSATFVENGESLVRKIRRWLAIEEEPSVPPPGFMFGTVGTGFPQSERDKNEVEESKSEKAP